MGNATIERISAHANTGGGFACTAHGSVTIRDSVCWQTGVNTSGIGAKILTFPGAYTVRLRNVTAIGSTYGIGLGYAGDGVTVAVDAKSVIADGASADVRASTSSGASMQIVLDHSNYATEQEVTGSGGVSATVTDPGTGTNQTAAPAFINAGHRRFSSAVRVARPSRRRHRGRLQRPHRHRRRRAEQSTGDGVRPSAPDIGADELIGSGPIDCDLPDTSISGGPTGPTADPTPSFQLVASEAGSSFECRLDEGTFAGCSSPHAVAVLADGSHTLDVRATDTAGNTDPTPASRAFAIDTAPPETTITKDAPKKTEKHKVKFKFVLR